MLSQFLRVGGKGVLAIANSVSYSDAGTPANPQSIPLPSDTRAGELLILVISMNNTTISSGLGAWTLVSSGTTGDNNYIYAKIATGTEGGSVSVTSVNGGLDTSAVAYRITNNRSGLVANTDFAILKGTAQSGTLTPNPPSLTVPWGNDEQVLWIAIACGHDGNFTFVSYPTNYTLGQYAVQTDGGGGQSILIASRLLRASTEDPGAFTTANNTRNYDIYTLAIRPQ